MYHTTRKDPCQIKDEKDSIPKYIRGDTSYGCASNNFSIIMKSTCIFSLVTVFSLACAIGNPSKIAEFDSEQSSVKEMLGIVKEKMAAGEKDAVIFPSGRLKLFTPDEDGEPVDAKDLNELQKFTDYSVKDATHLANVQMWIITKQVKWVMVRMDVDLPSKYFFELEKILSENNVSYIVSYEDYEIDGGFRLEMMPGFPPVPQLEKQ